MLAQPFLGHPDQLSCLVSGPVSSVWLLVGLWQTVYAEQYLGRDDLLIIWVLQCEQLSSQNDSAQTEADKEIGGLKHVLDMALR